MGLVHSTNLHSKVSLLVAVVFLFFHSPVISQVTIGAKQKPLEGTLLDLREKQENAGKENSTKGMLLPRVVLKAVDKLFITDIDYSDKKIEHTGLVVYNLSDAENCMSEGLYVWNGNKWVSVAGKQTEEVSLQGSYETDLKALKEFYNSNPGNKLKWNFENNPDDYYQGVIWDLVCGEKRVVKLRILDEQLVSGQGLENLTGLVELKCSSNEIPSLDLSKLLRLKVLICSKNKITNLDLSRLTQLTMLGTHENLLTSLDVSNLTKLVYFDCNDNNLGSLDVSNLRDLNQFICTNTGLTSIDVSNLTKLTDFRCGNNALTDLDLSNLTELYGLSCDETDLSTLNISHLTNLGVLSCTGNKLKTLDLSNLNKLVRVYVSNNQLTKLDVSNQPQLTLLKCDGNLLNTLELGELQNLSSLECDGNHLTNIDISHLTKLGYFNCTNNWFNQEVVNAIATHPNYCAADGRFMVEDQYIPNTTQNAGLTIPTCP